MRRYLSRTLSSPSSSTGTRAAAAALPVRRRRWHTAVVLDRFFSGGGGGSGVDDGPRDANIFGGAATVLLRPWWCRWIGNRSLPTPTPPTTITAWVADLFRPAEAEPLVLELGMAGGGPIAGTFAGAVPGGVAVSDLDLDDVDVDDLSTWHFAVPKKKVTRHKKRLKTTVQKRIELRRDIVTDPRTGEISLRHKMPSNWREYLPEPMIEEEEGGGGGGGDDNDEQRGQQK